MTLGTPVSSQLLDPSVAPQYPQGKVPTWPPRRVRAPRPQLCQFAVPLFAQLHWPFDFLKLAIRFPASGFLHMPSPLSATSFYSFRLADSHSSFGSWHQRHFLCEALLSRPPSRNPPVGGSHRSLFLSFMPRRGGGWSHLLLNLYLCGLLVLSVTMSHMVGRDWVCVGLRCVPSTAESR